jgi:hypothetical protein
MRIRPLLAIAVAAAAAACNSNPAAPSASLAEVPSPAFATLAAGTCSGIRVATGARAPSSWTPEALDRSAFLALAARHGGVVNVATLGVRPNTGGDVAAALQAAINTASRNHAAAVLLPAGEYLLGRDVGMVTGMAVIGEGCGRTIIRRHASNVGQIFFRVDGVRNVRVQGIQFDYNHGREFFRAIGFRGDGSRDVVIVDNCFGDSRPNTSGEDRFAVELSAETGNSTRVWIGRNRASDYMQLTGGGGLGIDILRIVDNTVDHAEQNAIAVTEGSTRSIFRDVIIARNQITNAHGIGIYVGPDKPGTSRGSFEDVVIADNVITGLVNRYAHAIYVRATDERHVRMTITGNVLDAGIGQKANGIRTEDTFGGGTNKFADVVVRGNTLKRFSRGIWVSPVVSGLVNLNTVEGGTRYLIEPGSVDLCVKE